eukprot:4282803-Pleurochrysis_carterae.AAC.3
MNSAHASMSKATRSTRVPNGCSTASSLAGRARAPDRSSGAQSSPLLPPPRVASAAVCVAAIVHAWLER